MLELRLTTYKYFQGRPAFRTHSLNVAY